MSCGDHVYICCIYNEAHQEAKLAVVSAMAEVLRNGLRVLDIQAPREM